MSEFRVYLLAALLIAGIYRFLSKRRKKNAPDVPPEATKPHQQCPHCQAPIEPGFLECWNCRRKFENATPQARAPVDD